MTRRNLLWKFVANDAEKNRNFGVTERKSETWLSGTSWYQVSKISFNVRSWEWLPLLSTSLVLIYHPEEYVDIGRIGKRNDESSRPSFWIFLGVPYRISYTSRWHALRAKAEDFLSVRLLYPPERRSRLRALPLGLDLAKCAIRFWYWDYSFSPFFFRL